jgi:Uma2 family endonuclease
MSAGTKLITAEEFARMHFDVPVELMRGEIVYLYGENGMTRPGPRHGGVCGNIGYLILEWARPRRAGRIATNDSWVTTERDPDTVRGADVGFYRMDQLIEGKLPDAPTDIVPVVCVEVRSPSNRLKAMRGKKDEYLAAGAEEVWLVDPRKRTVEVHRRDAKTRTLGESDTLTSASLPEFAVTVSDVFEGV